MALSRLSLQSGLLARQLQISPRMVRMGTSATDQMKEFWEKNEKLKRPSSPWIIYHFHLPMTTSLTHRVTGVTMGVVLYGVAIGSVAYSGDFESFVGAIRSLGIPDPVMFVFKFLAAFPLIYHYINGIRHLSWDAGFGFKLSTQYQTGSIIMATSITLALLAAGYAYSTREKPTVTSTGSTCG